MKRIKKRKNSGMAKRKKVRSVRVGRVVSRTMSTQVFTLGIVLVFLLTGFFVLLSYQGVFLAPTVNNVVLNWIDNSDNEDRFEIFRNDNGGGYQYLDQVLANVITYTDLGLQTGVNYDYKVRACTSSNICSLFSNEASIILGLAIPVLNSVTPETILTTQDNYLTVNGNGFTQNSKVYVRFGGVDVQLTPTSVSSGGDSLIFNIPTFCPDCIVGVFSFYVTNDPANSVGSRSNSLQFTLTSPAPLINSQSHFIIPNSGPTDMILGVGNFLPETPLFAGTIFDVNYQGGIAWFPVMQSTGIIEYNQINSELTVHWPASLSIGSYNFRLRNPGHDLSVTLEDPVSAIRSLSIENSCPTGASSPVLNSVSPNPVLNRGTQTLVFTGSGFVSGDKLLFQGLTVLDLDFVSSTQLELRDYDFEGFPVGLFNVAITRVTGCVSQSKSLEFYQQVPVVNNLNPSSVTVSSGGVVLIEGGGFYTDNLWNTESQIFMSYGGVSVPVAGLYVVDSDIQITLSVPAGTPVGDYEISVINQLGVSSNIKVLSVSGDSGGGDPGSSGGGPGGGGSGGGTTTTPQCNDNRDNDGDGNCDFDGASAGVNGCSGISDAGCSSTTDNTESTDGSANTGLGNTFECSDGIDNDNDNLVDFPEDGGCTTLIDNDESELVIVSDDDSSELRDSSESVKAFVYWALFGVLLAGILVVVVLIVKVLRKNFAGRVLQIDDSSKYKKVLSDADEEQNVIWRSSY